MLSATELLAGRLGADRALPALHLSLQVLVGRAAVQSAITSDLQVSRWLLGHSLIVIVLRIIVINRRQIIPAVSINISAAMLIIYVGQVHIYIAIDDIRLGY